MTEIGEWHMLFDAPELTTYARYLEADKVVELRQGPALIKIPLAQLHEVGSHLADFYEELAWWLGDQPDPARALAEHAAAERELAAQRMPPRA